MRGENVGVGGSIFDPVRFIPACAGKTKVAGDLFDEIERFIPACAGKTRARYGASF